MALVWSVLMKALLVLPLLATLALPPSANTIAVRTADLPDPFSPERNVRRWFGLKVKV